MKKLLLAIITLAIIVSSVVAIIITNADKVISNYSQKTVELINSKNYLRGISIQKFKLAKASLSSFNTITWQDVSATITPHSNNDFFSGNSLAVRVDTIVLKLDSFSSQQLFLSIAGLSVKALANQDFVKTDNSSQHLDSLTDGIGSIRFSLDFFHPEVALAQLKALVQDLKIILDTGRTKHPISLTAISSFSVRDENIKARLSVERAGAEYLIVLNKESLKIMSWLYDEKLTDPEIDLLSRNPFRAPKLLRIKDEAQNVAKEATLQNSIVPQDAYRHILWSYLLTQEYGPEFAENVTTAHEQGVTENTEAEHQMDYVNNRIGRQYALNQINQKKLLTKLLRDREVIREAK